MAEKKPLIRYEDTGRLEELRTADTLPGAVTQRTFAFFSG